MVFLRYYILLFVISLNILHKYDYRNKIKKYVKVKSVTDVCSNGTDFVLNSP